MTHKWFLMFGLLLVSALSLTRSSAKSEETFPEEAPFIMSPQREPVFSTATRFTSARKTSKYIDPKHPPVVQSLHINITVQYRFAQTSLCTTIFNPSSETQEITFNQAIPENALVSGFSMEIDGKTDKATLSQDGVNATLDYKEMMTYISTKDSKLFSLPVDVKGNTNATFCLSFEEILRRKGEKYHIPIHVTPNSIVRDLIVRVRITESGVLTNFEVSKFLSENEEYIPLEQKPPNACTADIPYMEINDCIGFSREIIFKPTEKDQKEIIKEYKRSKLFNFRNDLTSFPTSSMNSILSTLGLNGKFHILYGIEDPDEGIGQILYKDKYFVHYFDPPPVPNVNKHLIIVVDTYGYDEDDEFITVKNGLSKIINQMNSLDFINIIELSENVTLHHFHKAEYSLIYSAPSPKSDDVTGGDTITTETPQLELGALFGDIHEAFVANQENKAKAKDVLKNIQRSSRAHANAALQLAVECARNCEKKYGRRRHIVLPTILYITPGESPNIGTPDMSTIINTVTVKNVQRANAQIFALGVGISEDDSFNLLYNLTTANDGYFTRIYETEDEEDQFVAFYNGIASPIMSKIKFEYSTSLGKEPIVTNSEFPTIYWGTEILVAGEVSGGMDEHSLQATVSGEIQKYKNKATFYTPQIRQINAKAEGSDVPVIERIWAHLKVKDLIRQSNIEFLREDKLDEIKSQNDSWAPLNEEATRLSYKYNLFTPDVTTLVVKPNEMEIYELGIIKPLASGQEQIISNIFRKEFAEILRSRWSSTAMPLRNVTWLDDLEGYNIDYANEDPDPPQACRTKTTPPASGTCKHLATCVLPQIENDLETFKKYRCYIGNTNYLAICCPENHGSK